jgi:hypothetical protein
MLDTAVLSHAQREQYQRSGWSPFRVWSTWNGSSGSAA